MSLALGIGANTALPLIDVSTQAEQVDTRLVQSQQLGQSRQQC